jgi:hypothetical protein
LNTISKVCDIVELLTSDILVSASSGLAAAMSSKAGTGSDHRSGEEEEVSLKDMIWCLVAIEEVVCSMRESLVSLEGTVMKHDQQ